MRSLSLFQKPEPDEIASHPQPRGWTRARPALTLLSLLRMSLLLEEAVPLPEQVHHEFRETNSNNGVLGVKMGSYYVLVSWWSLAVYRQQKQPRSQSAGSSAVPCCSSTLAVFSLCSIRAWRLLHPASSLSPLSSLPLYSCHSPALPPCP